MRVIKATVWLAVSNFAVSRTLYQLCKLLRQQSDLQSWILQFQLFCAGYASYQGNSLACNLEFCSFKDFVLAMQAIKATVWLAILNLAVSMMFVQAMQAIKATVWLAILNFAVSKIFFNGYASYQGNSLACNLEFWSLSDFVPAMQAIKATVWLAILNFAVSMIFVPAMQAIKATVRLAILRFAV